MTRRVHVLALVLVLGAGCTSKPDLVPSTAPASGTYADAKDEPSATERSNEQRRRERECEVVTGEVTFENFYRCLGAQRGAPHMADAIASGHRAAYHLVEAIGQLHVTTAAPTLREELGRAIRRALEEERYPGARTSAISEAYTLAKALADLDRADADELVEVLRLAEGVHFGAWSGTLAALQRSDRAAAAEYVRDFLARTEPVATEQARMVLPVLVAAQAADMLPTLRVLSQALSEDGLLFAEVEAARIQLGDDRLHAQYRAVYRTPARSGRKVVPVRPYRTLAALGGHPDDAAALAQMCGAAAEDGWGGYDGIARYLSRLELARAEGSPDRRAWERGAGVLRRALRARTAFRDDENDRVNHSSELQARHHGALARLGSAESADALREIAAGDPHQAATWIAATEALRAGLADGPDVAAALLLRAAGAGTPPPEAARWGILHDDAHSPWRSHTSPFQAALLDAAIERMGTDDPRWVAALFVPGLGEMASYRFVRLAPRDVCSTWAASARAYRSDVARRRDVMTPMWTLTALPGNPCEDELEAMALDGELDAYRRDLALRLLAIQRSPALHGLLTRLRGELAERHLVTARNIAKVP